MQLKPHLNFDGQCEEAFKFYERCLGVKITFMITYGDSPIATQISPDWHKKILHATMAVGNQMLLGSDAPPDKFQKAQGFAMTIDVDRPDEAERIFKALADKATVTMPMQETFWAVRFGMLSDRFGTPWMINCGKGAA
jgi:PhnB protein